MKDSREINGLLNVLSWGFALIWTIIISLDYFNKHPGYPASIKYFQYPNLFIFLTLFFVVITVIYSRDRFVKWRIPINGLTLSVFLFILSFALVVSHKDYAFTETSYSQVFNFLGFAWGLIGFLFILFMVLRSAGRVVYRKFFKQHIKSNFLLDFALGLILFTLCLFVLGLFGQIKQNVIIALMFVFAVINLFYLVQHIKSFLIDPIDTKQFSAIGIISFCILVYFVLANYLSCLGPFPSGFDSRNFYVNISKLIADNYGLVEGYQPYYWSLFMSIGFALFSKVELALSLSFSAIVLCLLAGYRFARRKLDLDPNIVMFCLCLFAVTPAVTNQMYIELKVDFAMLFFQILCLEYLFTLIKKINSPEVSDAENQFSIKQLIPLIILLGLITGFALGVKMINMFLVFVTIVMIWWNDKDTYGTLAALALTILLFLLAGIDEISGLSKYHLSEGMVKIILLIVIVVGFVMSVIKRRQTSLLRAKILSLYLFASGLLVIPWIIKNGIESKSLSPRILLMGKDPGPNLTLNKMIREYENSKKEEN